jgi:hypothetical protein
MPDTAYERLQLIGSFGLTASLRFEMVTRKMGRGRRRSVLFGDRSGLRSWKLVYRVLNDTMDSPVPTTAALIESRADYLWNLFQRCKTGYDDVDRPFIITCLRDGKDYLVCFADNELSYEMFMTKLYSSGLTLEQTSRPDVNTLPDGSLGEATNNAEI